LYDIFERRESNELVGNLHAIYIFFIEIMRGKCIFDVVDNTGVKAYGK